MNTEAERALKKMKERKRRHDLSIALEELSQFFETQDPSLLNRSSTKSHVDILRRAVQTIRQLRNTNLELSKKLEEAKMEGTVMIVPEMSAETRPYWYEVPCYQRADMSGQQSDQHHHNSMAVQLSPRSPFHHPYFEQAPFCQRVDLDEPGDNQAEGYETGNAGVHSLPNLLPIQSQPDLFHSRLCQVTSPTPQQNGSDDTGHSLCGTADEEDHLMLS